MQKYKILDGILGGLPVFESAARHLSFTKAAEELRLTQPAISRRIASIEDLLGVNVFKRNHNKLELTPQGQAILAAVELGLGHLNRVISQIALNGRKKTLTIACGYSFATLWLQSRFLEFKNMLDDFEVHLVTSEFQNDLDPDRTDARILWDDNFWPDREVRPLVAEQVIPVCSPSFQEKYHLQINDNSAARKLSKMILLHSAVGDSGFLDWTGWFRIHGIDYMPDENDYNFDIYHFAIQAALDGEGIVLGLSILLKDLITRKKLVKVGPMVHHRDEAYFIEFASNRISNRDMEKIYNWFRLQIEN